MGIHLGVEVDGAADDLTGLGIHRPIQLRNLAIAAVHPPNRNP